MDNPKHDLLQVRLRPQKVTCEGPFTPTFSLLLLQFNEDLLKSNSIVRPAFESFYIEVLAVRAKHKSRIVIL